MNPLPRTLLPDSATIDDESGELLIGGVRVLDIAESYGTPTFVYDEAHLEARCREAVEAFPNGVAYASKAFLCKEMAKLADNAGMRIDVATGGEMYIALAAGVSPERLVFHGNNKSNDELRQAIEIGVGLIVVDSFDEIDRIEALAGTKKIACLLRVTPGIEAHTHEYIMTGQDDSKFGLGLASGQAEIAATRMRASKAIDFMGIHGHIGSQIFDTEPFEKEVEVLADFAIRHEARELCIGGGLGVAYVAGESAPTLSEWGRRVHDAVKNTDLASDVAITAEPGRSIVAAAAVTLYTVGTIKELPDIRTYLSVDGGMSDNPRPVLYGSGYEAFLPRIPLANRRKVVTVVGKHCESGDVLVRSAHIPEETKVGDILATPVTGAYGYSLASNYNRVPRPPIVFVKNGQARLVVRRETNEDLVRLDV